MDARYQRKTDEVAKPTEAEVSVARQAIEAHVKQLAADRFPGLTFGYIGNIEYFSNIGEYDDRSWMVFIPHPGRVGTYEDRVGGYRTWDLPKMAADLERITTGVERLWPLGRRA